MLEDMLVNPFNRKESMTVGYMNLNIISYPNVYSESFNGLPLLKLS